MSDEEINIAICMKRGWLHDTREGGWVNPAHARNGRYTLDDVVNIGGLPNHIDGIEALGHLHEAEKLLTPTQIQAYRGRLADACPFKSDEVLGWWAVTHATSRERAVGLVKVWGLYKDTL